MLRSVRVRLQGWVVQRQSIGEEDEGWRNAAAAGGEARVHLRADEYVILNVVSSPGGAEYVSWTCRHRIRNRRRDLPLYTVGKRALNHRTSEIGWVG